jgi:hypothetical protein
MAEHATLDQFVSTEGAADTGGEDVLFRFTSDQFVNEGIAELARQLNNSGLVTVSSEAIHVAPDTTVSTVVDELKDIIHRAIGRTHARTGVAREINTFLQKQGYDQQDERWIPPADEPFPGKTDGGLTIYPDDAVSAEIVEEFGIDPDETPSIEGSKRGLYALSPEFVGNSSSKHFPDSHILRFHRYFDAFSATLRGEHDSDDATCMACGSTAMPAYKDVDGEFLEYNLTFTVLASSSGRTKALGYGSRQSAHRGRCAACLVAGFYYSLMSKVVRPTNTSENDVRVFCPVGDLEELVNIRTDFRSIRSEIDTPTVDEYPGRQTLGQLRTASHGMQTIEFYEQVLRHLNKNVEGGIFEREITHRPTALSTYISEVGRTRNIRALETIDPNDWAYRAVKEREFGDDQYWPVTDVLQWFTDLDVADGARYLQSQNELAFGILNQDLATIEQAVFEFTKILERGDDAAAPYIPHQGFRSDYFSYVMSSTTTASDRIDDEAIESIKNVATSVGRLFHDRDDIGVLIKLQNASTPSTFLQAFEKAAMQAQKKSLDQAPMVWDASRDDDVSRVLQLVSDRETFDDVKRMFVIHASLAAQYKNAQESSNSNSSDE